MTPVCDFNLDVGEGARGHTPDGDRDLIRLATSVNVACGFHAGDPARMRACVSMAADLGVAVGAHPGFPDRLGFGRRTLAVAADDVRDYVAYQVGALTGFLTAAGVRLHHVKPHGALYMQAAEDDGLARALVETVASLCPGAAVYTQEGSAVWEAARHAGVRPLAEFHADRPLRGDGSIVLPTSVEHFEPSPEFVREQVRGFLERGRVAAFDGGEVAVRAGTIAVHSDGPDALALAAAVRLGAEQAGARLSADLEQLVGSRR